MLVPVYLYIKKYCWAHVDTELERSSNLPEVTCESTFERQEMNYRISVPQPRMFSTRSWGFFLLFDCLFVLMLLLLLLSFWGFCLFVFVTGVVILWKHSSLWTENVILHERTGKKRRGGKSQGERSLLDFLNPAVNQEENYTEKTSIHLPLEKKDHFKIQIQVARIRLKHISPQRFNICNIYLEIISFRLRMNWGPAAVELDCLSLLLLNVTIY